MNTSPAARSALAVAAFACAAMLPLAASAQAQPAPAPASAPAVATPAASVGQRQPAATDSQAQRQAVQPGNNAPVWREVKSGEANYTSIKGPETGVLIQPQAKFFGQGVTSTAGEAWRNYRNGPITFYGGWL